MRCKVGDLAVVVRAENRTNLGRIVRVVGRDDGTGLLRFPGQRVVWTVACHRAMTWYLRGKRYRRKTGPVPDNRLQPIRGLPPGLGANRAAGLSAPKSRKPARERERVAVLVDG